MLWTLKVPCPPIGSLYGSILYSRSENTLNIFHHVSYYINHIILLISYGPYDMPHFICAYNIGSLSRYYCMNFDQTVKAWRQSKGNFFLLHDQNCTPLAGDIRKHQPYINENFAIEWHRLHLLAECKFTPCAGPIQGHTDDHWPFQTSFSEIKYYLVASKWN